MARQTRERYSTTRLSCEFDHVVKQVKPVLFNYYSLNADTIIQESRLEFEQLIPRLPYIGGNRNPLTWNLLASAWYLTFYKVLRRRGETPEAIAKLMVETFEFYLNKTPKPLLKLMGWWKFTPFAKNRLKNRAAQSQQRHYPNDFVFFFVEGDGKNFDWGVDYTECAICKLYKQEGAENFARYLCPLDVAMSERMGLGLERTQTLAEGAGYCDFRFKRGRATKITTSEQPEQHTKLVESLRRQRMAKNHTLKG
jgi:L-2-amino-thiazoline-4-carboxylic acid hydrolase